MSEPINPDPVREWRPDHLPVYVSNGLIGLRFEAAPLGGVATVNGKRIVTAEFSSVLGE